MAKNGDEKDLPHTFSQRGKGLGHPHPPSVIGSSGDAYTSDAWIFSPTGQSETQVSRQGFDRVPASGFEKPAFENLTTAFVRKVPLAMSLGQKLRDLYPLPETNDQASKLSVPFDVLIQRLAAKLGES
ncbi:hypothetical protein Bind_0436 [Beijerinckia indica subsp. indica ATCC 9039]|uniref:Uncharacterized protein n=1 Tax=Beijerinckia indica subsp. indica (strain ATCC 9039 / DSM 1715 / NCIMB 8712) TaxID=395963 RepID=B2IE65_BEII9|nr:hypothetical protein Bind_0436 [Beijerinckia indica subsp. indica ATCC 9039]